MQIEMVELFDDADRLAKSLADLLLRVIDGYSIKCQFGMGNALRLRREGAGWESYGDAREEMSHAA